MGVMDWARSLLGLGKRNRNAAPAGVIEREFGVQAAVSRQMEDSIGLWRDMYVNHPPWETCDVRPLGLPEAIGRELARHALAEFSAAVSGSARAEYLNEQLQAAAVRFGSSLELGLCLGGVALKPYPEGDRIFVDAATTGFTPTRFDGEGKVMGGVFQSQPVRQGKEWFVRLEYHDFLVRVDGTTVYTVENRAFRSGPDGGIGAQVPLNTVRAWAGLRSHAEIEHLERPLFACFKPPAGNNIDLSSPMGVSVYAGPTVDLIRQADEQWEKLRWIFSVSEPKILSDARLAPGQLSDRMFISGAFTASGDLFQIFDPEVRDSAYYRGFQYILQRIEYNTGLAFGTISDPQSVEKTATEILAAKQRQFITVRAIQKTFQSTLDDLLYAMNAWCDLARLAPAGTYSADYSWGDSLLDDPDTRRQDMAMGLSLMNAGVMGPVEYRMRYFGENEETARRMLPEMEDMADETEEEIE